MKILFVCNSYGPFNMNCGAGQRSYFIMQALKKMGDVEVLQFSNEKCINNYQCVNICSNNDFSFSDKCRNIFYKHWPFSIFYLNMINSECTLAFHSLYEKKKYDIVIFRYLQTYILCGAPLVDNMYLDMDDVPWELIKQYSERKKRSLLRRFQFHMKYIMSRRQGEQIKKRFKAIFYSNDKDAMKYNGIYLPNIPYIEKENIERVPLKSNTLLFVGWLAHAPNVLGLDHFLTFVWPRVLNENPNAIFNIVGKDLTTELYNKWKNIKNVNLLGFVKSLSLIYAQSSIVVCPIYHGSGSNIKVLEALSYNKLCIISEFASRGFNNLLLDKEDFIISKNDDEFVTNICYALKYPHLVEKIANSGYSKIKEHFSGETILQIVQKSINQL